MFEFSFSFLLPWNLFLQKMDSNRNFFFLSLCWVASAHLVTIISHPTPWNFPFPSFYESDEMCECSSSSSKKILILIFFQSFLLYDPFKMFFFSFNLSSFIYYSEKKITSCCSWRNHFPSFFFCCCKKIKIFPLLLLLFSVAQILNY